MKILKFIGIILVVGIVTVLGLALMKPDYFRVERTATIQASASEIFPYLNNQKKSMEWSPWEKMDPDMERTFSGPESGVGASYAWKGDKNIGEGSMTITESIPDSKVVSTLEFIKPMAGLNTVEFTLHPHDNATDVTWSMHGPQPFIGKVMSVFMNCDKMIGQQFETGLQNLKNTVEAEA